MNHQDIDRRSLMMHRIIAERLRARPELIEIARTNMARWNCPGNGWWREWTGILDSHTVSQIADLISRDDEHATALRQSAPFVGILTPREVWRLKLEFKQMLAA